MARPISKGLRYAPLDVSFLQDRKIRRLRRKNGGEAPLVYVTILCTIYAEGYYIKWDDDLVFDIAELTGMDEKYIVDVVETCLEVGLLSREMKENNSILTSHGIQVQYQKICEQSKRKNGISEYSLLDSSEETASSDLNEDVSSEETHCDSVFHPKEVHKEKKSKVKEIKDSFSLSPSPSGEGAEEEKEKIVSFFTFQKNWASPCGEYEKLVAYNNRPEARKKWSQMSKREKESAVALWKQKDPKARFAPPVLDMWKKLYQILLDSGAPTQVRMAALDDGVSIGCDGGQLVLALPDALRGWIERDLDEFKPIIWPMVERMGCGSLKYRLIKPTNTQQLQL